MHRGRRCIRAIAAAVGLLLLLVAPAPACVTGVEQVGVPTQLDVLPEGLRDAAGAVGCELPVVEDQGGVGIVVLPREDADRVRMLRTCGRLPVAGDLPGDGGTRCTHEGGRAGG